ncbi:MAG: Acyl-CoA thioesterase [Mycobacterium sp.]|nr:Acyl-CoA thioesterase [Mycobacterium sp.]
MRTTLDDVVNLLQLSDLGGDAFEGTQPDTPNHHIVGGQIAAQALMAASRTAADRPPHSIHVYFMRRGDARRPVKFEVGRLHDGGTFSTREVTATQDGAVLMQGLASFTAGVAAAAHQRPMPEVPGPESLPTIEDQLRPFAAEFGGWWIEDRPFDTRYVDPPPRVAMDLDSPPASVSRIWLRARGTVPTDPVVNGCVLTYLSALTLLESALGPLGKSPTDVSALLDHTVWLHRPADFSDWLLYHQDSPSGVAGRALATGTFFNRAGDLVCMATQEGYFPAPRK